MFDLKGKVAILSGASKGIGRSMALALAEAGASIVVSSRKLEAVQAVAEEIRERGGRAVPIACHMGSQPDIESLVAAAVKEFGGVDIVVNNAATNPVFGPVLNTDAATFDKIMDVNVKGPFQLMKAVHPIMEQRGGGSIINIASVGGISPEPFLGIYSVSKAALISLTKVAAQEWGAAKIRVNVICPGLVQTKFSAAIWQNEAILNHAIGTLPLGRMAQPDELAGMALFLASDAASYCTGGVYPVDGGHTI